MSLSDPLKSLPVIHHFYPINPETALQQQSAVYDTPDHPLIAPIRPASSQPPQDAKPKSIQKGNIEEVDSEIQYLGRRQTGHLSETKQSSNKRQVTNLQDSSEHLAVCLGPRQLRRTLYVELPSHRSVDLTLHRPISLASSATQLLLGWGKPDARARSASQTSYDELALSYPSPSNVSEYVYQGDYIRNEPSQKISRGKKVESTTKVQDIEMLENDATTCHQCRRKTTKEKMHCRKLRPNGTVCPYVFCPYCIEIRYEETFDPFHRTWHCPRCRGICNCSICLRKAGFGYILDGSMSQQFTGTQGRLSVPGQGRNRPRNRGAKQGNQCGEKQPQVSVRAWLARKGIALGTEEWMAERRRQGVRYVVGKSPPPPDIPSPYMEAKFNPIIAACTEYIEEDDSDDPSDERPLSEGDADTLTSSGPVILNHHDATATSHTHEMDLHRESTPTDVPPNPDAFNSVTVADTHKESGSNTFPLPNPPVDASALPTPSEDLPGLSSAATYGLRLIIGKSFRNPSKKKKQLKPPKLKKPGVTKPKRKVDKDISNSNGRTRRKIDLAIRVGNCDPLDDDKEAIRGPSPISDTDHVSLCTDEMSTPPPAEPILVPTEYYAPSKLDATMANSSPPYRGHTYWSFNSVNPHEHRHEYYSGHGQGSSSSIMMSMPLYSNNDGYNYSQFSIGEAGPPGPSGIQSTSASTSRDDARQSPLEFTSLSNARTPDDYLNSQVYSHVRDVDPFSAAQGLGAFATADDTWAPLNLDPYPNLEIDMPPLQVEGITHTVDVAP